MCFSLAILLLASCSHVICGSNITVHLDEVALENRFPDCRIHDRANASNKAAFWMFPGDALTFQICLNETMEVSLTDLLASNDGGLDHLEVILDGEVKGRVTTVERSQGGEYWNEFIPSGQIGNETRLEPGVHEIVLNLTSADSFGMELDFLVLEFDKVVSADDLRCIAPSSQKGGNSTDKTCNPDMQKIVADISRQTTKVITSAETSPQTRSVQSTTEQVISFQEGIKSTLPVPKTSWSTFTRLTQTSLKSAESARTSTDSSHQFLRSSSTTELSSKSAIQHPTSTENAYSTTKKQKQTTEIVQISTSPSLPSTVTQKTQQPTKVNFDEADILTKLSPRTNPTTASATVAKPEVADKGDNSAVFDYENCGCQVLFSNGVLMFMILILLQFLC